jgi:hypothetical protein
MSIARVFQVTNKTEEKSFSTILKSISMAEAKKSKEFFSLFNRALHEQTKNAETLDSSIITVIKESTDEKYLEHVSHINNGNWLELDFNDPEFIRNIYKALRLELINSHQLATVTMWHNAINFFCDTDNKTRVNLHSFEEKGPYDPACISYSTPEILNDFKLKLRELPIHERSYFAIDLSCQHVVIFLLMYGLRLQLIGVVSPQIYFNFLEKYLERIDTSHEKNHLLLKDFPNLSKKLNTEAALCFLFKKFNEIFPGLIPYDEDDSDIFKIDKAIHYVVGGDKSNKLFHIIDNYKFLISILSIDNYIPSLVISSNYNKEDANSPCFAMILPTLSSFVKLQEAFHRKDTTYPELTVGQISPREMMYSLLKPPHNMRFAELVHPDVKHYVDPHGHAATTPFMLTWHDYFHIWRNGTNMYKGLVCHLIQMMQKYKKFEMSPEIWKLTDLDDYVGITMRENEKTGVGFDLKKVDIVCRFIHRFVARDLFWSADKTDHRLLIIIDMIINKEVWKVYLGCYPEDFFPKDQIQYKNACRELKVETDYHDFQQFHNTLLKMKAIINTNSTENLSNSALFFILNYRLNNSAAMSLLKKAQIVGLAKIFQWGRGKDNIYFIHQKDDYTYFQLSPEKLHAGLAEILMLSVPGSIILEEKPMTFVNSSTLFYMPKVPGFLQVMPASLKPSLHIHHEEEGSVNKVGL